MNIFRTFKFIIDPSNLNLNGPRFACPSFFEHERYREVVKFYDILPSSKKTEGKKTQDFFFLKISRKKHRLFVFLLRKLYKVDGEESERSWIERNEERGMDIDRVGVEQKFNRRRESSRRSTL